MTDETDTTETWIRDDESWLPDAKAVCAKYNIICLSRFEGTLFAYIPGKGCVSFDDLVKCDGTDPRPANIVSIK